MNFKARILFSIFCSLLFLNNTKGQNIYAYNVNVIDSLTLKPIPFSTVYWLSESVGVTDSTGNILVKSFFEINTITVSAIGYKTKSVNINSSDRIINIILSQEIFILPTVSIKSYNYTKEIGVITPKKPVMLYKNRGNGNYFHLLKVKSDKDSFTLNSVSVFIGKGSDKNIPIRLRVFNTTEEGIPGEEATLTNIILSRLKTNSWNEIKLQKEDVNITSSSFFIGVEFLGKEYANNAVLTLAFTDTLDEWFTYNKVGKEWKLFKMFTLNDTNTPINLMLKAKIAY